MASSTKVVYAAIFGNLAVAITKFIAAIFTGSSAMLTEGIHSVVDTGNGILLLYGTKLSKKPADDMHPFGYGKEVYFWTFLVAILIFGLGGGMSIYEGIIQLNHPSPVQNPSWNYVVLALAFIFESYAWAIAYKEFNRKKSPDSLWARVKRSKDPMTFTVLFEDTAALIGLIIAFFGVFLGEYFENPYFDGASSILIGIVLAVVAVFLAYESRGLLIGEGVDKSTLNDLKSIALADNAVKNASLPLTMFFGPDDLLVNFDIQFKKSLSASEIEESVDRIEKELRRKYPFIKRIYIEAESITKRNQRASQH